MPVIVNNKACRVCKLTRNASLGPTLPSIIQSGPPTLRLHLGGLGLRSRLSRFSFSLLENGLLVFKVVVFILVKLGLLQILLLALNGPFLKQELLELVSFVLRHSINGLHLLHLRNELRVLL
jgi:hypothetical protein